MLCPLPGGLSWRMNLRDLIEKLQSLADDQPKSADWEVVFVTGTKPYRHIQAVQSLELDQYPDDSGFVVLRSVSVPPTPPSSKPN